MVIYCTVFVLPAYLMTSINVSECGLICELSPYPFLSLSLCPCLLITARVCCARSFLKLLMSRDSPLTTKDPIKYVSSTAQRQWGDTGPGAMEHCLALLCSGGLAGVSPQAPGSATVASVDPFQRIQ